MSCNAFLTAIIGSWKADNPSSRCKLEIAGQEPVIVNYGARIVFNQPAVKTKARFLLTETSSWPEGFEGQRGMHYDVGVMKCVDDSTLQWSMAHNFGGTEIVRGKVTENSTSSKAGKEFAVTMKSVSVGGSSTITGTQRTIALGHNAVTGGKVFSQIFSLELNGEISPREHLFETYSKE